jgi:hypothetical protein
VGKIQIAMLLMCRAPSYRGGSDLLVASLQVIKVPHE